MSAQPVANKAPDLASEVREAIADLDSGNYLALTPEQLEEWAATGELRVLDEWLDESHD
jgi:hypothetical protein